MSNPNARKMISPLGRMLAKSIDTTTPEDKQTAQSTIDEWVEKGGVVIFSKSTCPRCAEAKEIFTAHIQANQTMQVLELDSLRPELMKAIQDELWDRTGARTVPRIYVNKSFIGGCDDLRVVRDSAKLLPLLRGEDVFAEATKTAARLPVPEMLEIKVVQEAATGESPADMKAGSVTVPTRLTGLQLKSTIMADLQLGGGFGTWLMDCNQIPFGSRGPIADHPFLITFPTIVIRRRMEEQKRAGTT